MPARRLISAEAKAAVVFLCPAALTLVFLRLLPAVVALADSLQHRGLLPGSHRVGFANYTALLTDPVFRQSVLVTLLFSAVINPLQVALALALALLYARQTPGRGLWRTLVVAPACAPAAVSALIWGVAYRPDGMVNAALASLGLPGQPLLTSSSQALWSLIVMLSWAGVGYWMLFLIAGINDIPAELYEAAEVDGAGPAARFLHVTLPLLRRPLAFVLVSDTVANFLVFAPVQLLTSGGPDGSTNLTMFDIYTRAYTLGNTGTAQAEVVLLTVLMVLIVTIQFRLLRAGDQR